MEFASRFMFIPTLMFMAALAFMFTPAGESELVLVLMLGCCRESGDGGGGGTAAVVAACC